VTNQPDNGPFGDNHSYSAAKWECARSPEVVTVIWPPAGIQAHRLPNPHYTLFGKSGVIKNDSFDLCVRLGDTLPALQVRPRLTISFSLLVCQHHSPTNDRYIGGWPGCHLLIIH
jgi:hypothetical protein